MDTTSTQPNVPTTHVDLVGMLRQTLDYMDAGDNAELWHTASDTLEAIDAEWGAAAEKVVAPAHTGVVAKFLVLDEHLSDLLTALGKMSFANTIHGGPGLYTVIATPSENAVCTTCGDPQS